MEKTNLKAIEPERTGEEQAQLAEYLFFVEAVLDVLACVDPGELKEGSLSCVAMEARLQMEKALKMLEHFDFKGSHE